MRLTKHHGLHNDFLVVLDERNDAAVDVGPALVRRLCDRRAGLGADGLIRGVRAAPSSDADVVMRLWNADGGRAEMSGNGIRCLAQAVAHARGATEATLQVDTDAGRRELAVTGGSAPHEVHVRVDMGVVGQGPGAIGPELPVPVKEAGTADLGNPHLVLWLDERDGVTLDEVALAHLGPSIEARVDGGINVELIAPGRAPDTVRMRVWERGVGLTQACGTGACAAAHLAHRWGLAGRSVTVEMPGGPVVVDLVEDHAVLTGAAVLVADLDVHDGSVLDG